MRRLLGLLGLLCLLSVPAFANEKAQGWCENGGVSVTITGTQGSGSQKFQQSYPSCTVTVYFAGTTTLATIYSDNANSPTSKANPFTSSSSGQWFFYANNGYYDVKFSGSSIPTPFTLGNIPLGYEVRSIKDFGAVGDGTTDDYTAIKNSAVWLCAASYRAITYPQGNYYIGRYKITGGASANGVTDINFTSCNNALMYGTAAKITIKGDFFRAADKSATTSYEEQVQLFFLYANHLEVTGFEIDGQNQLSTRNPAVTEGGSTAIVTGGCINYTFRDMEIHNSQTDGMLLGSGQMGIADKNVLIDNVYSHDNARNNFTIAQVRGITLVNSKSANAGNESGSYGRHSPGAGLDIEPDVGTPTIDVLSGNIRIENSTFVNNSGSQVVAGAIANTTDITFINNVVDASATSAIVGQFAFTVAAQNNVIIGNKFYISLYTQYVCSGIAVSLAAIRRTDISGNTFYLEQNDGMRCGDPAWNGYFHDNAIIIQAHTNDTTTSTMSGMREFVNNSVYVYAVGHPSGTGTQTPFAVANMPLIANNVYNTDFTMGADFYAIGYAFATDDYNLFNDRSMNPSYIRVSADQASTRSSGNVRYGQLILQNAWDSNSYNSAIARGITNPASGTWRAGDIVWNIDPAAGEPIGWICSVAGTPGTWLKLAPIADTSSNFVFPAKVSAPTLRAEPDTFANLPATPQEGMIRSITDSSTATWGAVIAGGGANRVLAYYNNANWTVIGK